MEEEIRALTARIRTSNEASVDVVDAMNRLAQLQLQTDAVESFNTSEQAIETAKAAAYKIGEYQALMNAGIAISKQHDHERAKNYFNKALLMARLSGHHKEAADAHARLGNACLHGGKYEQALEHYRVALDIRTRLHDAEGAAELYNNTGTIYLMQGNHALALKALLKALKTFEENGHITRVASASSNIALIYTEQQNYDEALKMFQRILFIRRQEKNLKEESKTLNNIGNVYYEQKNFAAAIDTHHKALQLRSELNDIPNMAISYQNLGNVYKDMGDYDRARDFYSRALSNSTQLADQRDLLLLYINLGELYFLVGEYENARSFLMDALKLAAQNGLKDPLRKAYEILSKLHARQKQYEEAYLYQMKYAQLDKEIGNTETSRLIAQMEVNHQLEQKERDAELERIKNAELQKAFASLEEEKKRSESLLNNILPEEVSEELKQFGKTKARSFDMVTVMFADIKNFTLISEQLTAEELVNGIDEYFEVFDKIVEKYGVEKIKTIGDAYLCAGGVPIATDDHAEKVVNMAIEFMQAVHALRAKRSSEYKKTFDFRIGIHSGPLVAGVVGIKKFAYDIWGDTVNTASRMQQHSAPNHINISESTYQLVKDKFKCDYRGEVEAKNKGKLKMYFIE